MPRISRILPRRLCIESLESRELLTADFTVAILPDTQFYAETYPAIFQSQTSWLASHIASQNITFVSQVGDVVHHGGDEEEWQVADAAMDVLDGDLLANPDGLVPYGVAAGNHDYTVTDDHSDAELFVDYFGDARYAGRSWYGGSSPDQLSHYQIFTAGGRQFLHLDIEWEPRDAAVAWAQSVLDAHRYLPTIVTTHSYLRPYEGHFVGAESIDGRDGVQIFNDLIAPNPQIFLVLSGHVSTEKHQVSLNDAGLPVIELLTNYQKRENGGNGWLQLLNFRPDLDRIDVSTYSPWLDQFETDANSQFTISLDFDARFALDTPPTASLAGPEDNGIADLNPAVGAVQVETTPAALVVQLADIAPGIDDATVSSAVITLRRNGVLLSSATDYSYSYDAQTDRIALTRIGGSFADGAYRLGVSEGAAKVRDLQGHVLAPTVLDVLIDTSVPPPAGDHYFTVDTTITLPGGVTVNARDVAYFNGTTYQVHFDGSDVGLVNQNIDALSFLSPNELLLSFSSSTTLAGIAGTVRDADIVKFTATQLGDATSGLFSMYFDASDVEFSTSAEDIDALAILPSGNLLVSTQGAFSAGGITGDDEDLLEFQPTSLGDNTSGTWSLYFDGSDVGLAAEDIDGVQVYPNGQIYLSNTTSFSLPGIAGKSEDIFKFIPTSLGAATAGTYAAPLYFDGSNFALGGQNLSDFYIPVAVRPNRAPVAEDDMVFGNEDVPLAIDVTADNGNGPDGDSDGTLNLAQTAIVAGPAHGTLQPQGGGVFLYTPHVDYFGDDSFTYTVADNRGDISNVATVTIHLADINDAPVARNDAVAASPNTALIIDVLANNGSGADSDAEGMLSATSVAVIAGAEHGSLVDNGDGTFTYTPESGYLGGDSFTYTVSDIEGELSNVAMVTITVQVPNAPPIARDDAIATSEDQSVVFNVLADNGFEADSDSDGALLPSSVAIVAAPSHGTLQNLGSGQWRYVPQANYFGDDSFTYTVLDNQGAISNVATVSLSISSVNDAPLAFDDAAGTEQDVALTIHVLADNGAGVDFDLDGTIAPATVAIVTAPAQGTAQAQANGSVVYTPLAGFTGSDSFTYRVSDNEGGVSNVATVSVSVTPPPVPELLFSVQANTTLAGGLAVANEDIIAYDGTAFRLVFDGSDVGLGSRTLSAFDMISPTEILLAFTSSFTLPGIAEPITASDIVKFTATSLGANTAGEFSLWFDGSDVGLTTVGQSLDAIERLADGRLLLSITEASVLGGVTTEDEDLIAFTPTELGTNTAGTFAMHFDGSQVQIRSQDIDGAAVDAAGVMYFSAQTDFTLGALAVADDDVFTFSPTSLGTVTSGTYGSQLRFDGSNFGLADNDVRDIDITTFALPALTLAAPGPVPGTQPQAVLPWSDAEKMLSAAIDLWSRAGASIAGPRPKIAIVDLPGAQLGLYQQGTLFIDADAAGHGWYVDATPGDHVEFARQRGRSTWIAARRSPAYGRVDLLSVVAHELGHALGLEHANDQSLMSRTLGLGERRLLAVDAFFREYGQA